MNNDNQNVIPFPTQPQLPEDEEFNKNFEASDGQPAAIESLEHLPASEDSKRVTGTARRHPSAGNIPNHSPSNKTPAPDFEPDQPA